MTTTTRQRRRQASTAITRQAGSSYFAPHVTFVELGVLPELSDLQRAVGVDPDDRRLPKGTLRDAKGQWVAPDSIFYPDAEAHAYSVWVERESDRRWERPNRRGITELGTYRSKRKAADQLRKLKRRTTCDVCGLRDRRVARSQYGPPATFGGGLFGVLPSRQRSAVPRPGLRIF